MTMVSAGLARSITKSSSTQSYLTIKLMADRDLIVDAYRAYAYFRWVDDFIDIHAKSRDDRICFLEGQKDLIDRSYRGDRISIEHEQEEMLSDLIANFPDPTNRLQSYIQAMMSIMDFDAHRRGRLVTTEELSWYSKTLGKGVMDAIQFFIGNRCHYPDTPQRNDAAIGAHIAHMLRDTYEDTEAGFINIPREVLEAGQIQPTDYKSLAFRTWVKERVSLARRYQQSGKAYFDEIVNLRCRIVGHWYCARFENILHAIEQEEFLLRPDYPERKNLSAWSRMAWLGFILPIRHILSNEKALQIPNP